MGAWGHGSFDNDNACDWEAALAADGKDTIESALFGVNLRDLADESDCAAAIAACEVVAAANGHPMQRFKVAAEDASVWLKEQKYKPAKRIVVRAEKVAAAVRESSGLADLWSETADFTRWKRSMSGLIVRLGRPPTQKEVKEARTDKKTGRRSISKKRESHSETTAAITVKRATQIVRAKLAGDVGQLIKGAVAVHLESTRKLSQRDAKELATLTNVSTVTLDSVKVAAEKIAAVETMLRGWTSLKSIDAGSSLGLANLLCRVAPDLPRLARLELFDTEVTDTDIVALSTSSSLQSLGLGRSSLTQKSLEYLTSLPNLKRVDLCECGRIRIAAVNRILDAHGDRLDVSYYPSPGELGLKSLTAAQESAFGKQNKRVRKLIDNDWDYVWINLMGGELEFGQLLDMERLRVMATECKVDSLRIGVNQSPVREEYSEGLRFILNAWPDIRSLEINEAVTLDDSFADVYSRLTKLQSLALRDVNVTDKSVRQIANMDSLVHLELVNTQITKKSLARITALPKLRWLKISTGNDIKAGDLLRVRRKLLETCYVQTPEPLQT